jgi:putative nucleotidyltransferase with HDIG domain
VISTEQVLSRVKKLPTLSTTMTRLWALTRDDNASAADFEKVIRPDPALTANLLRVANSAYFGLRCRAESVRHAVTLLGIRRVCELATSVAFAPVIPSRLPGYEVDASAFWTHSVAVAVFTEKLSQELRLGSPDMLFTAGLLHDIGKLVVGSFVDQERVEIKRRVLAGMSFIDAEREVLGIDHGELGATVAQAWSLPPAAVWAARWHHRPGEVPPEADRTMVGLVHAADALAHAMGFGADAGELARHVDAEVEGRLGVNPRRLEAVASRTLESIREMGSLFANASGGKP